MNVNTAFVARDSAVARMTLSAFGQSIEFSHLNDSYSTELRLEDVRKVFEPFLASRVIPLSGVCVDVGAGEGWFCIPFASAFRSWHVVAFEGNKAAFDLLRENVSRLGLENITCVNANFHPALTSQSLPQRPAAAPLSTLVLQELTKSQPAPFHKLAALGLYAASSDNVSTSSQGESAQLPALPVSTLTMLNPDFIKIEAPGCEQNLLSALNDCSTSHITGRLHTYLPSWCLSPSDAREKREHLLVFGKHSLRRDYEDRFEHRQGHLDVVVAMYNTKKYILECIDSILVDGNPDIRVIVVDDGSTDGSGDLVEQTYANHPRVQLLRKANGGCASARNFGRECSKGSYIAFVDADDRVDQGMFSALLEAARYTGAFVVEGEFKFLHMDADGGEKLLPSYEADVYAGGCDHRIGPVGYRHVSGRSIMGGQPTIWRRIHRRDFLDRRKIWFPEHVRAFDDQIFQLMVAHYCDRFIRVSGYAYHYRQHPDQDIKQGDERHFYSFNMFRSIFIRALDEDWKDVSQLQKSLLNTMAWSYSTLRPDLKEIYRESAVEFLAVVQKTFGIKFTSENISATRISGLNFLLERRLHEMKDTPTNYGLMRLENWRWQPEFIRMMRATKSID